MSSTVGLGADPNNNTTGADKCYSLRPRAAVRREEEEDEDEAMVAAPPPWRRRGGSRPTKRKPKPAPLSKYRRKTANARERSRMREINEAFDCLRRAVPGGEPEKLTKITTLRLAMKYIAALSDVLACSDSSLTTATDSDVESLLSDSTTHEMSVSDNSLTPPLPSLALLDSAIVDGYSDFSDHALDPYADFSSFILDDPFAPDFS